MAKNRAGGTNVYDRSKDVVIVSDLDVMERLVQSRHNLIWDGWEVLKTRKHPTAFYYKDGRLINGRWFRTERIRLTREGWIVPGDLFKA